MVESRGTKGMEAGATAPDAPAHWRLHPAYLLVALAAYVACSAFFIGADPWDPLAGWGWALLLLSSLALGLVGGRRWMLTAPLVLILLAPFTRALEPPLFFAFTLPLLIIFSGVLVALGIGLRAVSRRRGPRVDRRAALAGVGLLALTVALTGWGSYLDHRVVDRAPGTPLLVDGRTGSFRALSPGAPASRARRLFGEPVVDSGEYVPRPLDVKPREVSSPGSLPGWQPWRYSKLVVFTSHGRVRGYLTTDPAAQTEKGIGIGDSIAVAERRHPGLRCYGVTLGSDAVNPSYPACHGRLPSGHEIFFGGDPIDSIWVQEHL